MGGVRRYASSEYPTLDASLAMKSPEKLKEFDEILDVREADELDGGQITFSGVQTRHIPVGALMRDLLSEDIQAMQGKKLLVYCRSGARSQLMTQMLRAADFDATNLDGGFLRYKGKNEFQ